MRHNLEAGLSHFFQSTGNASEINSLPENHAKAWSDETDPVASEIAPLDRHAFTETPDRHDRGENAVNAMGDERLIPVIIGVGEICDRPGSDQDGLDALDLMHEALRAAERDCAVDVLGRLDWLGVEDEISFPMPAPQEALSLRLPSCPPRLVKTLQASGDGPLQLVNDAANLIGSGEIKLAACVGAEALRTAARRAQAAIAAGQEPATSTLSDVAASLATPLARRYGLLTPIDVYPLYENATRAAWGQTLDEGQEETGAIWSLFSEVAAENPNAWLRQAVSPSEVTVPGPANRMVSFPYTKLMVANASVNMGAAIIVASLEFARELGIPQEKMIFVGRGAAAHEEEDFLRRESYARLASLETTVSKALELNALGPADIDHVELYSCFPCVPKMARRVLGWPTSRPASVYGGLTFGGGPIGNCMMHAAARMVHKLRDGGNHGLIVANGGYATHSHSMAFSRRPIAAGAFPQDYSVQAEANANRGAAPVLLEEYTGPGTIETFNIPFGRAGEPLFGTVIARNPGGARFLAHVPGDDPATLAFLMSGETQPVGTAGMAVARGDRICWVRSG